MKNFMAHLKTYIFRGILASIPIALSYFVLRFFYIVIDKRVVNLIEQQFGFRIPGIGIVIFLVILYFLGFLASNFLGRQLLSFVEHIANRIPIINSTYQIGKQLSSTFALPEKEIFKKAVLIAHFRKDVWTIGFVTGTIVDGSTGEKLIKVFVPTVPNPTSGFLAIVKESEIRDPGWTVEEGMKAVISAGIISPPQINNLKA